MFEHDINCTYPWSEFIRGGYKIVDKSDIVLLHWIEIEKKEGSTGNYGTGHQSPGNHNKGSFITREEATLIIEQKFKEMIANNAIMQKVNKGIKE